MIYEVPTAPYRTVPPDAEPRTYDREQHDMLENYGVNIDNPGKSRGLLSLRY
jgi:hypothetical protein